MVTAPGRTARRRRAPWRGPLIFLLVVAVLLVVLDRVALVVVEQRAAGEIQTKQDLASRPSVSIKGFPFLTQVIADHFGAVELHAKNLTAGDADRSVTIGRLDARVTGIDTNRNYSTATAATVAGTATLDYTELSRVLGAPLSYAGPGRLRATETVTVLGQPISGSVSAAVGITGGTELSFSDVTVAVSGTDLAVPQAVTDQLSSVFKNQLSLSGLPFGLRIQSVAVTAGGVSISATGHDVTLN